MTGLQLLSPQKHICVLTMGKLLIMPNIIIGNAALKIKQLNPTEAIAFPCFER